MNYQTFIETIKSALEKQFGASYELTLRSIPKNNGIVLDGLSLHEKGGDTAPTIYLNEFYKQYQQGDSLADICGTIRSLYLNNSSLPFLDTQILSSLDEIREQIAFKLIHFQANSKFLQSLPHLPFHDMSIVFYLLMKQPHGYMTALIHNDHLKTWEITPAELWHIARENTPKLLPPQINPMGEVLKTMVHESFGSEYDEESILDLLDLMEQEKKELPSEFPNLFVLTNRASFNGAACMAYPGVIKNFADTMEQDIVILPSSIHEVLLFANSGNHDFEQMSHLVKEINDTEVPLEDRLSNQVYYYSRKLDKIQIMSHAPELAAPEPAIN